MHGKTVAIGCDHAGFELKTTLKGVLQERNFEILDCGTNSPDSVDYPDFGHAVAEAIEKGEADWGVLVCGSGIGISMVANRHKGIRAALCTSPEMAEVARAHTDANILVLGERFIDKGTALACLGRFIKTPFEGGRHTARVEKI